MINKKIYLPLAVMAFATAASASQPALTPEEQVAFDMLYQYMPMPDKAANDSAFFANHVKAVFRARREMPWGKDIPEKEFLHFVVPPRVNNEVLSPYSTVLYEELKERVKDMDIKDAILEVNHWCHEKVTYQPSDGRTHSPLQSISSAIGRCGEESTFTVSALRTVGIPARQVYTPRWAHTDDNHAWVEAWADGQWWFLGACEPEPVLNLGWFNSPASRGMLMNTRVFGDYSGDEEELLRIPGYTDINVTDKYAPMKTTIVTVQYPDGSIARDAEVAFCIYNYAEYYPLAKKKVDSNGSASLRTGKGSMMVWARDNDGNYGMLHVPGEETQAIVTLDGVPGNVYEFDLVPPRASWKAPNLAPEVIEHNELRKAHEDSIRTAYTATFKTDEEATRLAEQLSVDKDDMIVLMRNARGNHRVIIEFLTSLAPEDRARGIGMLKAMSVKDMTDVTPDVLAEHIQAPEDENPLYIEYILNPRIASEFLVPYRTAIRTALGEENINAMKANPRLWKQWVDENIKVAGNWQPATVYMDPRSVVQQRLTNAASRNLFYVAGARAIGIPARMDLVRMMPQYADASGNWIDVTFNASTTGEENPEFGTLRLTYTPTKYLPNPGYYYNFTLTKIDSGNPELLNYPDDATFASTFSNGTQLEPGRYILTSGQRMASGAVLARSVLFDMEPGAEVDVPLVMRQDDTQVSVIGSFNSENIYHDKELNVDKSILSTTGRGYYVLIYGNPNHEPTNHALRDIAMLKERFEENETPMLLLFADEGRLGRYDAAALPEMPATMTIGADVAGKISSELTEALRLNTADAPVIIIADTFNRVVYQLQGYSIGIGQKLLEVLTAISE